MNVRYLILILILTVAAAIGGCIDLDDTQTYEGRTHVSGQ